MSGSEKMPGGNDQRIAAALCHCSLFENPRRELLESCADMLLRRSAHCIMTSMHDQD